MTNVALKFLKAYKRQTVLVLAPLLLLPLLTFDELDGSIPDDQLCRIFQNDGEKCDQTITRLESDRPTMYKVLYIIHYKSL